MKKYLLILVIILASVLRLYKLAENPPSLYWDEASLGYNAYSILQIGEDEHGEKYPLARFIAFGDYKPPGYIYIAASSIAVFGMNDFAVRFPSALSGILMTIFTYYLSRELFGKSKISLLASFFMAVSPWSIHLSRVAYEANLAALFNLLGIYFFLKSRKSGFIIIFSLLSFVAAFYTFNANRIISPLMLLLLFLLFNRETVKNFKWNLLALVFTVILLIPSIGFLKSSDSKLRLQEVSIFTDLQPVTRSNARVAMDNGTSIAKLIHNRRLLYLSDYLRHFSDNFTGRFLFTHGDINPRLHVQGIGQLYFFEFPLIILGLLYLLKKTGKNTSLLIFWMFISAIPASVARETPHALRIVSILPSYQILTALGVFNLYLYFRKLGKNFRIFFLGVPLCLLLIANMAYYLHLYMIHFPVEEGGEFQYGTKEMVNIIRERYGLYDRIFVTPEIGRPYIFFAYYLPYPPGEFVHESSEIRDPFGFYEVERLGKIEFSLKNSASFSGKSLIVSRNPGFPANYHLLSKITDLSGDPVLYVADNL